ncbi:MAG TPA: DUF5990 family protein [Mucilaginibacter sp.]|nr:DUF5990 family protein [Mucilaginibacter sp.]
MDNVLSLRIILEKPPAGIDFALQSGSGNKYETVQNQLSGTDDLIFEFTVKLKQEVNGQADFGGPVVQGNKGERFVYIDIGTYAGNLKSSVGGRMKVPLRDIAYGTIEKLIADDKLVLETHVPGTGRNGGPNYATVKPFAGWSIANS